MNQDVSTGQKAAQYGKAIGFSSLVTGTCGTVVAAAAYAIGKALGEASPSASLATGAALSATAGVMFLFEFFLRGYPGYERNSLDYDLSLIPEPGYEQKLSEFKKVAASIAADTLISTAAFGAAAWATSSDEEPAVPKAAAAHLIAPRP